VYPFDPGSCNLRVSKHFRNTKMRSWGWDYPDLRDALAEAHQVDRRGRSKFEVWVRKRGSRKLVVAYDKSTDTVTVITGTEG